jgi:putative DNA primase/helicase
MRYNYSEYIVSFCQGENVAKNIDSILQLASLGLRIHPLLAKNKVPIIKAWQEKATCDEAMIHKWSATHPDCNWGMATGSASGVFVVDLDPKSGGDKSWRKLLKDHPCPNTPCVITGSGGSHLYFRYPKNSDIRNSASKVGKGIDVRGEGGQVVIPPSTHPNGTLYKWKESPFDIKFAKAPRWLLDLISTMQGDNGSTAIGDKMEKGTRNSQIYHQSLHLARQGALQEITVGVMKAWCKSTGETDMPAGEIEATVASAYKYHAEEDKKVEATADIELSDTGNAQRLLNTFSDKVLYTPSIGWHIWDDRHWGYDDESLKTTKLAMDTITVMKGEVQDQIAAAVDLTKVKSLYRMLNWAITSHNVGRLKAMTDASKSFPQMVRAHDQLDCAGTDFLLNLTNGTLDMRTGILAPHDPRQYITRLVPHAYDPKAKCPTWLQTLRLAFYGDQELIDYFQRAIGYSLSAALSEQCFFICWGESGNNGKSTLMEAIQRILGPDYATMVDARVVASRDKDNHVLSSLAMLNKVRIVSINEVAETAVLDEELIKQLTGGDTLQAKKLYMDPFTYKPVFKIWLRANNRPTVRGTGEAFWRRVKLIPFVHPIPLEKRRPRHEIDALLTSEAGGILAWAVRGFQTWYKTGLQDPEEVRVAAAEYRNASDIVNQFFEECLLENEKASVSRQTLYYAFREWSRDQGLRYTMTASRFAKRLNVKLNQVERAKEKGVPVWTGIELNDNAKHNYSGF